MGRPNAEVREWGLRIAAAQLVLVGGGHGLAPAHGWPCKLEAFLFHSILFFLSVTVYHVLRRYYLGKFKK